MATVSQETLLTGLPTGSMAPGTMGPSVVGTTAPVTQVPTVPVAPAPVLAPVVPAPATPPVVSTSTTAQQDVNNKMNVMTNAGPALTPAQIQANIAGQNTATPNSTAYGPTTQTGNLIYDPNLPKGFAKDATGRIFKVPEGATVTGAPTTTATGGTTVGGTTTGGTTTGGTTGGTGTATGGTGTGETGGTDASAAAAQAARDAATKINQDAADAQDTQTLNDINAIKNGTYALTPNQQAQIDAMTQKYGLLIEQQKVANQNYQNAVGIAGFRSGIAEGAMQINQGNIAAAVSAGLQSIAQINSEMFDAITKAKDAFMKNDLDLINASYSVYSKAVERRQKVIDDTYKNVTDAIKAQQDAVKAKNDAALQAAQIKALENAPLDKQNQIVQQAVADIIVKYPDAGISPTDTPAQIAEKVQNSASWKAEQAAKANKGSSSQWRVTSTFTDVNGTKHSVYTNLATGAQSQDGVPSGDTIVVGPTDGSGTWSTQTGMRTDRNNNPIAVSNAAPEFMNVLKAAGVNFTTEEGADFGGGLKTLKFATPQDGIEGARALLAGSPMAFSWYSNHTGKVVLAQYGIKSNADFAAADKATQDAVIKGIYQAEGGNGSLVGESPAANTEPTGGAIYATLDAPHKAQAQLVASYDADLSRVPEAERKGLLAAAKELNPDFSQSDYAVRQKFRTDWTSGQTSRNINSINTFSNHVGELVGVMTTAANSKVPAYNGIVGWIAKESGNTGLTPANASIDAVATEFAKILKGGGTAPTDTEIASAKNFLHSAQSPQQTAAVTSALAGLMSGRVNALRDQYRDAMGAEATPILRDSARASLRSAGIDPNKLETSYRMETTAAQFQAMKVGDFGFKNGAWFIKTGPNEVKPY